MDAHYDGRRTLDINDKFVRLGSLWYSERSVAGKTMPVASCKLLLDGIRIGSFMARAHKSVQKPPFIKGDIKVLARQEDAADPPIKHYLWCGYIWADEDEKGVVYHGYLEVDPTPTLLGNTMARVIAEARRAERDGKKYKPRETSGFWLPIDMEDKE